MDPNNFPDKADVTTSAPTVPPLDVAALRAKLGQKKEYLDAQEDARDFYALMQTLRRLRSMQDVTQSRLAKFMGTSQSAVSTIESGDSDARFTTLQRYARGLGGRLVVRVAIPGLAERRSAEAWLTGEPQVRRRPQVESTFRPEICYEAVPA